MVFIVLLALVAAASASVPGLHSAGFAYNAPLLPAVVPESPAHYDFGYDVSDPLTGDIKGHHESRRGDTVHGSYSLIDADGSRRTVDYSADGLHGFNAVVHQEAPVAVAPLPLPAAPVAALPTPVAPIARYAAAIPAVHEEVRIAPVITQEVIGHTPVAVNHQEFGVAHRPETIIQPAPIPIPIAREQYHVAPLPIAHEPIHVAPLPVAHEEFRVASLPIAHEEFRFAPSIPIAHESLRVASLPLVQEVSHLSPLVSAPLPVVRHEQLLPSLAHEELAYGRLALPIAHQREQLFGGRFINPYLGINHHATLPYGYPHHY